MARLFPPQCRDWDLSGHLPLSPHAHRRVTREAVCQAFSQAAKAINEDWQTHYDPKHIQRFAEVAGQTLLAQQTGERQAYERGQRPSGPANDPALLVIGMDGGRIQSRAKNEPDGSRWRENKVLTITSYLPGEPEAEKAPTPLVSTYLGTIHNSKTFGTLARLEAERRGIRQAKQVVVIGDGAGWIDTLHQQHFHRHVRIVDWYHASEHLHDVAKAAHPEDADQQQQQAKRLTEALWNGQAPSVAEAIETLSERAGPPRESDPADHPRRVLKQNAGYFQRHAEHMNYPAYRARGWAIGSGMTESGVKQFNKRVKGTEQFWSKPGAETILALRALWLSNDNRWDHYWLGGQPRQEAA